MKISEVIRHRAEHADAHFEIDDPDTKKPVKVVITFDYTVEPTEYEGGDLFYQGGASMENSHIKPFQFQGKSCTSLKPEMVPYIKYDEKFLKTWDDTIDEIKDGHKGNERKVLDAWEEFLFDELMDELGVNEDIPKRHYPRTT